MDQHQRRMWEAMIAEVHAFDRGQLSLTKLVADLQGLFVEADPHQTTIREDFLSVWSRLDAENELRTESWAPAGAATEEGLSDAIRDFTAFVDRVLAGDSSDEHR